MPLKKDHYVCEKCWRLADENLINVLRYYGSNLTCELCGRRISEIYIVNDEQYSTLLKQLKLKCL